MSSNRKMNVKIESENGEYTLTGNKCGIVRKTGKTRLGLEFDETIKCGKFKVKKTKNPKKSK